MCDREGTMWFLAGQRVHPPSVCCGLCKWLPWPVHSNLWGRLHRPHRPPVKPQQPVACGAGVWEGAWTKCLLWPVRHLCERVHGPSVCCGLWGRRVRGCMDQVPAVACEPGVWEGAWTKCLLCPLRQVREKYQVNGKHIFWMFGARSVREYCSQCWFEAWWAMVLGT